MHQHAIDDGELSGQGGQSDDVDIFAGEDCIFDTGAEDPRSVQVFDGGALEQTSPPRDRASICLRQVNTTSKSQRMYLLTYCDTKEYIRDVVERAEPDAGRQLLGSPMSVRYII